MSAPGTIGITGISGFIGSAIAARYVESGWTVRGLDRSAEPPRPDIDYVQGDVCDPEALARLVRCCDAVVHTAAIVAESGDWREFQRVNAEAPLAVALAARAAGATDVVHLSSVMVHGFDYPDRCTEDSPLDPAGNLYCTSKIRAERALRTVEGIRIHVLRPGDVYGPGSIPWIRRPLEHMRDRTFLYVRGSVINHLYVDNLVDALETVLGAGDASAGRAFIVTDGVATPAKEFWGWFAQEAGMRWAPTLPRGAAERIVGAATRVLPERAARRLDLDRESIRYLGRSGAYSNAAIQGLGWRPRIGLAEGRERTAEWLRSIGLLP